MVSVGLVGGVMGGWEERDPETKKRIKLLTARLILAQKRNSKLSHLARQRSDPSRRRRKASSGFV